MLPLIFLALKVESAKDAEQLNEFCQESKCIIELDN